MPTGVCDVTSGRLWVSGSSAARQRNALRCVCVRAHTHTEAARRDAAYLSVPFSLAITLEPRIGRISEPLEFVAGHRRALPCSGGGGGPAFGVEFAAAFARGALVRAVGGPVSREQFGHGQRDLAGAVVARARLRYAAADARAARPTTRTTRRVVPAHRSPHPLHARHARRLAQRPLTRYGTAGKGSGEQISRAPGPPTLTPAVGALHRGEALPSRVGPLGYASRVAANTS
jgi:hypothetical protein